ncbi:MAG: hypothetical protein M1822_006893 [Bathelium mastoideum]|nr:MAG: hypothetical protein M1822_006893 [Bathelium mastoideum]
MEVTYRAHPQVALQVAYLVFEGTNSNQTFHDFIQTIIANSDRWASEGWGGYIIPAPPGEAGLTSSFLMMTPKLSASEAKRSMEPIFNFSATLGNRTLRSGQTTMLSFYSIYEAFLAPDSSESVDISVALGSRLVPRSLFQSSAGQQRILTAITDVAQRIASPGPYKSSLQILVTTPIGYPGDNNTSSVTPAWRSALWHTVLAQSFSNQADATTIRRTFAGITAATQILRRLAPDSGAYQNEADVFEPDPVATFWGADNYERLRQIKTAVDPGNILTCWDCVGWDKSDERYACYPDLSSP